MIRFIWNRCSRSSLRGETLRLIAPLFLVLALAQAGCGGSGGAVCAKQQECSGGNDADLDACVAEFDGESDVASAYDCNDQFSKLAACLEEKGTCKGSGKSKFFSADCDDESESLSACEKAGTDNN